MNLAKSIAKEAAKEIHKLGMTFSVMWFEQTEAIILNAITQFKITQRNRRLPSEPTSDEVHNYGLSIGLTHEDCQDFIDHFSARGWCYSVRSPMRDYKGALRTWKAHGERNGTLSAKARRLMPSAEEQRERRRRREGL